MASGNVLRSLRIGLMVYLLLFVAVGAWLSRARSTDWNDPLWVGVFPIAGDASVATARYIDGLTAADFDDVERFVQREAARYGVALSEPVKLELGLAVGERPPAPPADRNVAGVILWSLKLRYWAWRQQRLQPGPDPDIRVYMVFFDPADNETLAHSLGLQKGLIGVVNAFASQRMRGSNNVVLAHEVLHTLGATDKYDGNGLPLFPDGYAHPHKEPLHPQTGAEIMGGRIAVSPVEAVTPRDLSRVVVGPATAAEIRWTR